MKKLELKTKIIFSSKLGISGNASEKILNICKTLGARHYITGTTWAKTHLKTDDFKKNKILVDFQEYEHPIYSQLHGEFMPKMSIIDLLFNEGKEKSKEILLNVATKSIKIDL